MADDVETFLKFVLERSEELSIHRERQEMREDFLSDLLTHVDLLGKTVEFLHEIGNVPFLDSDDLKRWRDFEQVYYDIETEFIKVCNHCHEESTKRTLSKLPLSIVDTGRPGRPGYYIPKEVLVELRGLNFSWCKILKCFGVSRWTVMRRVEEYGLTTLQKFSIISDERIDDIIKGYISRHGSTTGEPFMSGYFRSLGLHIQRSRIRAALNRVDPHNTVLRWGTLVSRRRYFVPWPNSLWHIDGQHSLIRWKFVIHGCCDGKCF